MEYNEYRGVRGLVIAEITADGDTYTTGTWKRLSGAQNVALATSETSESHFYDNLPVINILSEGADVLTLTISVLDEETKALVEGREFVEGANMFVKTPKLHKQFALGFIGKKTNGVEEINILYKGTFTGGNETHATETDGTEANNVEYTFTAIYTASKIHDGKQVKSVKFPISGNLTEDAIFGTFSDDVSTSDVLTPDEIVALI